MKYAVMAVALVATVGCRAAGNFQEEFTDACAQSGDLERPVCECLATKAEDELSDTEQQFLLAALREDEARTAELRVELGIEGAMRAGMFMTNVATCALGQSQP